MFVLDTLAAAIERRREREQVWDEELPDPTNIEFGRNSEDEDNQPDQPPPTAVGRCRLREDVAITPAERKAKYARFTEKACNAFELHGSKRAEVQDFSGVSRI
jgi:hypothetical protein